ncbi:MAG: DUF4276 family protein, partial [Proteobacteria bacterium]|nr:DUF4276 family protein [Pseudomonadota bacterium]
MKDVVAIVEGQTEQAFVREQLAPHLAAQNINMWATLSGRMHKHGGVTKWESVRSDILRLLAVRKDRICTTMFDFYGMPKSWPGREEAAGDQVFEKGNFVEQRTFEDIAKNAGKHFRESRFTPYVPMYEFEALLFADTEVLAEGAMP